MAGATGDVLLPSQVKMDDDSYELILKLMLEDSRQLAEGKGKQKEGNISDTEVAFNLYAKEIENALTIDADHRLVMSIQQALSTDANALTQLQDEERMAQHDHEVAIALSEGRDPPPMPTSPPAPDIVPEASLAHDPDAKPSLKRKAAKDTDHAQATKVPRTGDFDSARRSDKGKEPEHTHAQPAKRPRTETFDFRDETDDGKDLILHGKRARLGESSSWAANRQPPRNHRTCTSCIESTPELLLIRAPCQHEYCHDCIKSLFTLAMRDETLFPPKCCQQAIPAEQHARILGSNLVHLYHAKQIEFSTENRTYCHNTECGKFINSVDAGHCSSCGMRTCTSCKKVAHLGDCPQDAELHRILEMAEQKGWRRCTKCNSMVELSHGCNHMTCRCSHQFCYMCGVEWKDPKECRCPLWNEENLILRNNEVQQRRHILFDVDLGEPLDINLECNHQGDWRRVRGDELQCDNCAYNLPYYLYECTQCQLHVCRQCRFHRL